MNGRQTSRIATLEEQIAALKKKRDELDQEIASAETELEQARSNVALSDCQPGGLPQNIFELEAIRTRTLVTKASSVMEKHRLFCELFAGRPDVHAHRFENTKSGKCGYVPACKNERDWGICKRGAKGKARVHCADCEHQDFPPISEAVFAAHITGGAKDNSDVLGAYPMRSDNKCTFILADFDEIGRKDSLIASNPETGGDAGCIHSKKSEHQQSLHKTALAFCAVCWRHSVPVYMERSRSGRGIHVWLFFTHPVEARLARRLMTIRKLSPAELDSNLASLSPNEELGELVYNEDDEERLVNPWEKRKPEALLTKKDFDAPVSIVRANMLHLVKSQMSAGAINKIRRLAAFRNPDFYKHQGMRLGTWDKPRVISSAEDTKEYLSIPRGCEDALVKLLDTAQVEYRFEDKTECGQALDVSFTGALRAGQEPAADALLRHNIGTLSAPTGFGKTVLGAYLIAQKAVNALVLVPNAQLYEQWLEALNIFLEIQSEPAEQLTLTGRRRKVDKIGQYSSKKKCVSGLVDVVMIQSLLDRKTGDVCVYDYVDVNVPTLEKMYHRRLKGYRDVGYRAVIEDGAFAPAMGVSDAIFNRADYWQRLSVDIQAAEREVVISGSRTVAYQITRLLSALAPTLLRKAVVTVITKPVLEYRETAQAAVASCIGRLKDAGVKVVEVTSFHPQFVVVDKELVWYGSINPLGHIMTDNSSIRFKNPEIAEQLLMTIYNEPLYLAAGSADLAIP